VTTGLTGTQQNPGNTLNDKEDAINDSIKNNENNKPKQESLNNSELVIPLLHTFTYFRFTLKSPVANN